MLVEVSKSVTVNHTLVQKWNTPKSDDFRRTAVETTHIILLGHMMACWKGKSLNYIGKIVLGLFWSPTHRYAHAKSKTDIYTISALLDFAWA